MCPQCNGENGLCGGVHGSCCWDLRLQCQRTSAFTHHCVKVPESEETSEETSEESSEESSEEVDIDPNSPEANNNPNPDAGPEGRK